MNRAVEVLAQKAHARARGAAAAQPLRELGMHPDGGVGAGHARANTGLM